MRALNTSFERSPSKFKGLNNQNNFLKLVNLEKNSKINLLNYALLLGYSIQKTVPHKLSRMLTYTVTLVCISFVTYIILHVCRIPMEIFFLFGIVIWIFHVPNFLRLFMIYFFKYGLISSRYSLILFL